MSPASAAAQSFLRKRTSAENSRRLSGARIFGVDQTGILDPDGISTVVRNAERSSGRDTAMSIRLTIIEQMRQIAAEQEKQLAALTDDLVLLESGLDSLGFAVLVARLEDLLGLDPFTASDDVYYPVTLGEFIRFYENAAKSAKRLPAVVNWR